MRDLLKPAILASLLAIAAPAFGDGTSLGLVDRAGFDLDCDGLCLDREVLEADLEADAADEAAPALDQGQPGVVAAAWCAVRDGEEEPPGCDVGIGMALHRWGRLSIVAVLGTHTLGAGLSWTAHRARGGQIFAVAVGLVVPHGEVGIDIRKVWLAFGATVAFTGAAGSGR